MNPSPRIPVILLPANADQAAAIDLLVDALADEIRPEVLTLLRAEVFAREGASSTYLDNGLSIPHGRIAQLDAVRVAVGVSAQGVLWPESGQEAKLVILLAVPSAMVAGYLVLIQRLLRWYKNAPAVDAADFEDEAKRVRAAVSSLLV